ncbi:MAG: sulfur reduction protein DsrE [Proteobacteria bacterium]|nr:sulfur reduction protein DsrE [Pseudomonadota bacterium]
MSGKFCVTLKHCRADGDKATLAYVVANAALGSDKETMMFLMSDGVWAAVKGEAEKVAEGAPFAPLKDLIDKFVAGGGKMYVCAPCMKKRGIEEGQLIDGADPAGGAVLVSWLSESPACVDF